MIYYALISILLLSLAGAGIYTIGFRFGYARAVSDEVAVRRYLKLHTLNGETLRPRATGTSGVRQRL